MCISHGYICLLRKDPPVDSHQSPQYLQLIILELGRLRCEDRSVNSRPAYTTE